MSFPKSLLDRWKEHPSRRAEFEALLQEPAMQDAIAIVKEQTFSPRPIVPGMPNLIEFAALMSQKREGYLEMLTNFLSLAGISPFKSVEKKPWETSDKDAALARMRTEEGLPPQPPPA